MLISILRLFDIATVCAKANFSMTREWDLHVKMRMHTQAVKRIKPTLRQKVMTTYMYGPPIPRTGFYFRKLCEIAIALVSVTIYSRYLVAILFRGHLLYLQGGGEGLCFFF